MLETLPPGARVLLVRLRSLGDCVLTTPAIALLKNHRPDLTVGVMVEDRFAQVFEGNPDVALILKPSYGEAAKFRPSLALNFHGGTRSAALTTVSLAPRRAGFQHFRQSWVYNIRIPRAQEILGEERMVHTAEHLASAMFYLGVPRTAIPRARLFAEPRQSAQPYAVIHPTASAASKSWPAERFAALGAHLRDHHGLQPVFIGAAGDDLSPFAAFEVLAGAPLRDVKSLLAGATLFAGNDSGPAHMAAAFGVPVVVLYGSSDPQIWAPWRTAAEVITAPEGLDTVPVERIEMAVDRLRERAQ